MPDRISLTEAAEALGVNRKTLQRWRKKGAPFHAEGRGWSVDLDELRAWAARTNHDPGRPVGTISGPKDPSVGLVSKAAKQETQARGAPPNEVAKVARELRQEVDRDFKGAPEDLKTALAEAELRKRLADAEAKERANRVADGELVSAREVQEGRLARIAAVRNGLLQLAGKLSPRLEHRTAEEIEAELDREVRTLLHTFAGDEG